MTQPNEYKSWLAIWDMMSNWDTMSKSNCDQQFHSQKTVHEDNYCLHLLDMCFLWRLVWWGKTKRTTSNEAPTSDKAFAREGRLWWKEKTRKSLPSKERNATKAEEKLDAKGDKNLGSKTLSSGNRYWALDVTQHPPLHHPSETCHDSSTLPSYQGSVTYIINQPISTSHYLGTYQCKWVSILGNAFGGY